MITGSSQADVALILIPADGNFTTSDLIKDLRRFISNYPEKVKMDNIFDNNLY